VPSGTFDGKIFMGKRFVLIDMDDKRKKRKCMRIDATPLIPLLFLLLHVFMLLNPANAFPIKSDLFIASYCLSLTFHKFSMCRRKNERTKEKIREKKTEKEEGNNKGEEGEMREIEVVYEKGVLKPLERLDLREGERVRIFIKDFRSKLEGVFGILEESLDVCEMREKGRR